MRKHSRKRLVRERDRVDDQLVRNTGEYVYTGVEHEGRAVNHRSREVEADWK